MINPSSSILSLIGDVGKTLNSDGQILKWDDQSGCGNDAVALAQNLPYINASAKINGKDAPRFGGAGMKVPVSSSDEYSFFFLINSMQPPNEDARIFMGSNNAPGARWAFGCGKNTVQGAGWGGAGNVNLGNASYVPVNAPVLITYIKKPEEWSLFSNGVFVRGGIADDSKPTYPDVHDWVLGDELNNGQMTYYFQGLIGQILICEEALKNGARKKVEREIMAYWGL